jgi:uncharacterized protein
VTTVEELYRLPTDAEVAEALQRFAERARLNYGARLKGLYLFGSRARGDHHQESDADVAIILEDGDWRFWDEKMHLVDLGHDMFVDFGLYIQPWPFAASAWASPAGAPNQRLIESAKRDARSLAMKAVLEHRGIDVTKIKTHHGLMLSFEQNVVKRGLLEREIATAIQKAAELRRASDYEPEEDVAAADVHRALKTVSSFIDACARLIETSGSARSARDAGGDGP